VREAIKLEDLPVQVYIAADGEQALNFVLAAEKNPDAPFPDLVLLDLNLPKVDGLEVLRQIRASQTLCDIAVLVVTSSDSPNDRSGAAKMGAGYFRKPVTYDEFLKMGPMLRAFLREKGLI
jgi:DNA-binding response OmpR family regulator